MDQLLQTATTGLNGLEAAVWTLGGLAVNVAVAFVAVRLVRRAAKSVG